MKKIISLSLAGAAALLLLALPLSAKRIPPDQVHISTPVYTPAESFHPHPGRYSYAVSWNGIQAASVELELDRNDDVYEIRARAWTVKGLDMVFKLRYESEAVLAVDTLKPKHSFFIARTNARQKTIKLEFLPGGEIISVRRDNEGKEKTLKFVSENFTLDPFSAGFLALSQDWKVGDSRQFDLFNGNNRYLIEFSASGNTVLMINGKARRAIVLTPTVRSLTDAGDDDRDNKLRRARIYISADQPREILKISSELLFGHVDTEMVGFTPAAPKPLPAHANKDATVIIGDNNQP